jgi:hypothetical protein
VQEAVEDIISRGVGELRKNAFGDDLEDSKALPWTREQAWVVLKQLSKQEEVGSYTISFAYYCPNNDPFALQLPYYDLLIEFPFKGDDTALRNMEHAELITISTHNGARVSFHFFE